MISESGDVYDDVIYAVWFRLPLLKQASFTVVRINLTQVMFKEIQSSIAQNNFPRFRIVIYKVNELDKVVKELFSKEYKIIHIRPLERMDFTKNVGQVQLTMTLPVLHFMGCTNTYNKILESKTGYEIIKDFEKYIEETYGKCFHFNHIGTNEKLNRFKYEQVLTRARSDLEIPSYIISNYKPFHSFSFYFFDDFNLGSPKDICATLINMYDPMRFKRFDVSEHADFYYGTRYIGKSDFSDVFYRINRNLPAVHVWDREKDFSNYKMRKGVSPQLKSQSEKFSVSEGRDSYSIKSFPQYGQTKQSLFYHHIYAPDNVENALERLKIIQEAICEKIALIEMYETRDTFPDWLQFGRIYNMDRNNPSSFTYTPISIVHIFTRENERKQILKHHAQYSMMKFFG
ncbi:MAG: hypothetical protein QW835_00035 [Candidatus Hadarchaeum sp.]